MDAQPPYPRGVGEWWIGCPADVDIDPVTTMAPDNGMSTTTEDDTSAAADVTCWRSLVAVLVVGVVFLSQQ